MMKGVELHQGNEPLLFSTCIRQDIMTAQLRVIRVYHSVMRCRTNYVVSAIEAPHHGPQGIPLCIEHPYSRTLAGSWTFKSQFPNPSRTQDVSIYKGWCLTTAERPQRRSYPRHHCNWLSSRHTLENPFLYCDYRSRNKGALMHPVNLKRLGDMATRVVTGVSSHWCHAAKLSVGYPTLIISAIPRPMMLLIMLSLLPTVRSAGGDDDDLKIKLQPFDGVVANFTSWLISFSAWIAWKKPELMALVNGTENQAPEPTAPDAPTPVERKKIKEWQLFNTQLYGAIVTHVTSPIQASLHVNATGNGIRVP